jgi:cell wall-associated NlpC family hydrolase
VPKPPGQTNKNALNPAGTPGISGGGADGQIEKFVQVALAQTGKPYIYGFEVSLTDPNPRAFDCSELVQYAAAQAGIIPAVPDGSEAQINDCDIIPIDAAIGTRGALLWHPGHIAISLGNGRTIEASSSDRPIGQLNAKGRFQRGGLIRGAHGYPGRP